MADMADDDFDALQINKVQLGKYKKQKECDDNTCCAFNFIDRNDKYESKIKAYRFHIGNVEHPLWSKEFCQMFGDSHIEQCPYDKCPFINCSNDGNKTKFDILAHLWKYKHSKYKRKSKKDKKL